LFKFVISSWRRQGCCVFFSPKNASTSNLFLSEYDESEQLVLESCHRHCEVDDGCFGADFWGVGRVAKLRCDVQPKRLHHLQLLVTDLHFQCTSRLDEVLLKHVVESRVKLLADVFDQQGSTQRQTVFQVSAEILVIQVRDLQQTWTAVEFNYDY